MPSLVTTERLKGRITPIGTTIYMKSFVGKVAFLAAVIASTLSALAVKGPRVTYSNSKITTEDNCIRTIQPSNAPERASTDYRVVPFAWIPTM